MLIMHFERRQNKKNMKNTSEKGKDMVYVLFINVSGLLFFNSHHKKTEICHLIIDLKIDRMDMAETDIN